MAAIEPMPRTSSYEERLDRANERIRRLTEETQVMREKLREYERVLQELCA